jgi:hypothetical protein
MSSRSVELHREIRVPQKGKSSEERGKLRRRKWSKEKRSEERGCRDTLQSSELM